VTHASDGGAASPVTFFFPYYDISGVPMLFARLARHLAAHGTPVDVIDFCEGYMARTLRGVPGVRLRGFAEGTSMAISANTLLVMQSILPATIRPELEPDAATRVLFWTLHPMNLVQSLVPLDAVRHLQSRYAWFHRAFGRTLLHRLTRQLRAMVETMHAKRAIAFMDGETLDATCQRLELTISDPLFLPVACPVPGQNRCEGRQRGGPLGMAWLGRLSDFKIHILLRTLEQASRHAARTRLPIVFHIIGDGPEEGRIAAARYEHEWFTVVRAGVVAGEKLDQYLVANVDLLAAMGTSALEGARLGVPTMLLDVSYGAVPASYRFGWLHDSDRSTLGRLIDGRMLEPGNDSLARIIESVRNNPAPLSAAAYRYCREQHSLDAVGKRFLDAAAGASFRWADIDPALRRKGMIRSTYEQLRHWRRPAAGAAS
jgi:hypothetical protein